MMIVAASLGIGLDRRLSEKLISFETDLSNKLSLSAGYERLLLYPGTKTA
jgi:hypothetical protein